MSSERRVFTALGFKEDDSLQVRTRTLQPDEDVRGLVGQLATLDLIVLTLPKASEGRIYSQARILREELGYKGRLRAVGAVVVDAVFFMHRCGIDELILRDVQDEAFALAALTRFSVRYQDAADAREPR